MQKEKKYFASANTENGFVSYFDEIYGSLDMVYIIKGGPGTGKSSFIRKIADEAEKRRYSVEYFYCSADPLSLDGIIVEELKTAVVDGTAPHNYDPKIAGIRERIINLGDNWDNAKLRLQTDLICRLTAEKNNMYNNVYNYLSAAGRIEGEIRLGNKKLIDREKMENAVRRISRQWKKGSGFAKIIRPVESLSHAGHIIYSTYHAMAENRYSIRDKYGIGGVFLEYVMNICFEKGMKVVYSPRSVDPTENVALYLPDVSTSFVVDDHLSDECKVINMDRFIDFEMLRNQKNRNRFARRCLDSLYEGVQIGFDNIFELHSRLEKCYIESMDFSKNERILSNLKREIFL